MNEEYVKIAIEVIIMIISGLIAVIFKLIYSEIKDMSHNIKELNDKIALILSDIKGHDYKLEIHEARIKKLERVD